MQPSIQLHLLFDKHYTEQVELMDELAERVTSLGGVPLAAPHDVAEASSIPRPPKGRESRDETGAVRPLDVRVGDRVLFGKWSGTEVLIDGEDRLIMKEADVFGVIEGDAHSSARAA